MTMQLEDKLEQKSKSFKILWIIAICVVVFLVSYLAGSYLYSPFYVLEESMEPTLYEHDIGIKTKIIFGIQRFDIVLVDDGSEYNLIKRVIGLPGENVRYEGTTLYINGEVIAEDFIDESAKAYTCYSSSYGICSSAGLDLDENSYFVMGDNRAVSIDSRALRGFQYTKNQIVARAFFLYGESADGKNFKFYFPKFL